MSLSRDLPRRKIRGAKKSFHDRISEKLDRPLTEEEKSDLDVKGASNGIIMNSHLKVVR
jgi:hypothetical protein